MKTLGRRLSVVRKSVVCCWLSVAPLFAFAPATLQAATNVSPEAEQHIRDLIRELPADSSLRQQLVKGAHGDGVHHEWMNDMRQEGIKKAVVWVRIRFNRSGKPKQINVDRTEYFTQYEEGERFSDIERLRVIRASTLEQKLAAGALEKAEHGYWVDLPGPRPHPFTGTVPVVFYDDEWLPTTGVLY